MKRAIWTFAAAMMGLMLLAIGYGATARAQRIFVGYYPNVGYSSTQTYYQGDMITTGGQTYISLPPGPQTGNTPSSSTTGYCLGYAVPCWAQISGSGGGGLPSGTGLVAVNGGTGQLATPQILQQTSNGLLHFNSTAAMGDSTMNCEGPATSAECYGAQLMRDVPGPFVDYGVSGTLMNQIARTAWSAWGQTDSNLTTLITYQGGVNDANAGTIDNTGGLANGLNSLIAGVSHVAIPLANQQLSSTAAATGTWTSAASTFPVNAAMTGNWQQSTVNGSTTTYTLPSGANIFYWWGVVDGNLGTFTVKLNGTLQTNRCTGTTTWINYGCNGQTIISGGGIAMGGALLTGGSTTGSNTLVVTVTSATGAGNVVYDGGAATVPSTLGPNVIAVMGLQKQAGDAMSTATADYNNDIVTGYGILSSALSNLFFVDMRNGVTAGTGYPGARGTNTTTDYAVTTACPGPTNGAGTTPLHFTGCGVAAQVAIVENAAAAAGYPIAIKNVGNGSYFSGPVISTGLGYPGQVDYRDDWKIGTSGRYNNAARMPGLIFNAGSAAAGNINTDAGARAVFEHVFDNGVNGDAFKLLTDNGARPVTICLALPNGVIASDVCPYAFYPGNSQNTGGAYYRGTTHIGANSGFNTTSVGVGSYLALAYDSQQAVTGASSPTALEVYLKTGTTTVTLPTCVAGVGQNAANWVQHYHKDSTDTGTITFAANTGDTVNGGATVAYSSVPNFTEWTAQCSQNTATTGNVSLVESTPSYSTGSTANSATFAASGGASPGAAFNGSSATTIDPTTLGLPLNGTPSSVPTVTPTANVNILQYTGELAGFWIPNNQLSVTGGQTDELGGNTATAVVATTTSAVHNLSWNPNYQPSLAATTQVSFSVFVKANGYNYFDFGFHTTYGTTSTYFDNYFNVSACTATTAASGVTIAVGSVTNGFCPLTLTYTLPAAYYIDQVYLGSLATSGTVVYAGDGVSGAVISHPQLSATASPTTYQDVTGVHSYAQACYNSSGQTGGISSWVISNSYPAAAEVNSITLAACPSGSSYAKLFRAGGYTQGALTVSGNTQLVLGSTVNDNGLAGDGTSPPVANAISTPSSPLPDTRPTRYQIVSYNQLGVLTTRLLTVEPGMAGTVTNIRLDLSPDAYTNGTQALTLMKLHVHCNGAAYGSANDQVIPLATFVAASATPIPWDTSLGGMPVDDTTNGWTTIQKSVEIPFVNGCQIDVTAPNTGLAMQTIFSDIAYKVGLYYSAPWRKVWRAVTTTYSVSAYGVINALPTVTVVGGGELDSIVNYETSTTQFYYLEGNPIVYADGVIAVTANGQEDFWGTGYYGDAGQNSKANDKWGFFAGDSLRNKSSLYDTLSFRNFKNNNPNDAVRFNSTLQFVLNCGAQGEVANPGTCTGTATTIYLGAN